MKHIETKEVQIGPKQVEIPSNWSVKKLHEVCTLNEKGFSPDDSEKEEFEYIDIESVDPADIKNSREISVENAPSRAKRKIHEGDVLISTVRPYLKAFAQVTPDFDGAVCSSGFAVISKNSDIQTDYFTQYALGKLFVDQMTSRMTGTSYPAVNNTDFRTLEILTPPLSEQKKIAAVLSQVDEIIQETETVIEKTEELKKGLMQDLLIKGIDHDEFKEVKIGPKELKIPKIWTMEKCGDIFDPINGRSFSSDEWADHGKPIIRIQDLREDSDSEVNYCSFEVEDKFNVDPGDLLFSWAGNIKTSLGAYIWSGPKAVLNQHIYNLRPKREINKTFFKNALNYHLYLLKTMVSGSAGQIHITKGDFQNFKLPFPSPEEQHEIGKYLFSVDQKIQSEKEYLEEMKELKKGLMQDLLTGKVRVTDLEVEHIA